MGCDIHTRIEYLNRNEDWVCGDFFRINPYYSADDPCEREPYSVVELCDDRNYELFAVLADVRNYAGVPYIDEPRGIPADACARTRFDYKAWGVDAHSASYFTLEELMEWNEKAESVKRSGMVSPEDAARLDAGEEPVRWCQWTNMEGWVKRTWSTDYKPLDHLIDEMYRRGCDLWLWFDKESAKERAGMLRIVFWFDN